MLHYLHLLEAISTTPQQCHLAAWEVVSYTTRANIQAKRTEEQAAWIRVPTRSGICFSFPTRQKDWRQLNKSLKQPKQGERKHDVLRIRETGSSNSTILSSFRKLLVVCQQGNTILTEGFKDFAQTFRKYAEILSWSRCYIIPNALDYYLEITFYHATSLRSCAYKCGNFTPRCVRTGNVRDALARWKGTWIGLVAPYIHAGYVGPLPTALNHSLYWRWSKWSVLSTDITDVQGKGMPAWRMLPFCFVCPLSVMEILGRMSSTCHQQPALLLPPHYHLFLQCQMSTSCWWRFSGFHLNLATFRNRQLNSGKCILQLYLQTCKEIKHFDLGRHVFLRLYSTSLQPTLNLLNHSKTRTGLPFSVKCFKNLISCVSFSVFRSFKQNLMFALCSKTSFTLT
jgi:hypothetical protein